MGTTIKVALVAGFVFALPVLMYQLTMFIAPAVSVKTQKMLLLVMPVSLILFGGGVALGYFMILPTMFKFLLTFGNDLVTPMFRISDYLNLLVVLLAGIGLSFETPLIMFILAKLRVVSYKGFRKFQKWMILLAFIIGAIFDPSPNPFDQLVVAGIIIVLYQIGILLAWAVRRRD
jgi:sec-independent protein translocase protein TatC